MKHKFFRLAAVAGIFLAAAGTARAAESKIDIKGYLQTMYSAGSNGVADSFSMRLARLVFTGKPNADWSYQFQVDATANPSLLDAYLDFSREKLLPEPFTFKVRAGQFRIPFSLESLSPDSELDTINRAQVVNTLSPGRDLGTKGRDIGAYAQLTAAPWRIKKFIELTAGQFNGEGANAADKNHYKGLALRAVVNPSEHFSFGVSDYEGNRFSTATASNRTGLEAAVYYGPASFKAEYIRGRDTATKKEGWYAQLAVYALPKTLQAVAKYDVYDPDTKLSGNRTAVSTAGLNWFFTEGMRLQTNYEWKYWETGGKMCNTFSTVLALTF
ncbi:MAG TPA: porin [Elusimicrobiales bacterium]|nr:porin [Elusimicrobiales bacterium]